MAFFSERFLDARREDFLRAIAKFQYKIGSTWYEGEINSKLINGTNVVVLVNAPGLSSAHTIKAVRLIDNNGAVAGEQSISLQRAVQSSTLLQFSFPLVEIDENL